MTRSPSNLTRVKALASWAGDPAHEYCHTSDHRFDGPGRSEWLVLTDEEADKLTVEHIIDSLWAFRPEFLAAETGLPVEAFKALSDMCENAQEAILAMIKATCGTNILAESAIQSDGRGLFLAQYDGEEVELAHGLYAYRTN
jgi:hypothetical protein